MRSLLEQIRNKIASGVLGRNQLVHAFAPKRIDIAEGVVGNQLRVGAAASGVAKLRRGGDDLAEGETQDALR
jgi:hypothetical protein